MHTCIAQRATTDQSEVRKLYCTVDFVPVVELEASKLVTIEAKSRSQTPSLGLKRHCVRTILTTFYHLHHYHYAATARAVSTRPFLLLLKGLGTRLRPELCMLLMILIHPYTWCVVNFVLIF
jgi:hypothetical protein